MFRPFVQRFVFFNGKVAVKARLRSEKAQRHQLYRLSRSRNRRSHSTGSFAAFLSKWDGHGNATKSVFNIRGGLVSETNRRRTLYYVRIDIVNGIRNFVDR